MQVTIFTGGGPVFDRSFPSVDAAKRYVVDHKPQCRRRGYSHSWETDGNLHRLSIANSRGRVVGGAAVRVHKPSNG